MIISDKTFMPPIQYWLVIECASSVELLSIQRNPGRVRKQQQQQQQEQQQQQQQQTNGRNLKDLNIGVQGTVKTRGRLEEVPRR